MTFILALLWSACTFIGTTRGAVCPLYWTSSRGSCYSYFPHREPWTQANYMCEQHGGHLAIIETAAENAYVTTLIQTSQDKDARESVWIGSNDMMREGSFEWVGTDEPLTYSNWYPGEPSNGKGTVDEDCVEIDFDEGNKWNDAACSKRQYFVCERSPIDEVVG